MYVCRQARFAGRTDLRHFAAGAGFNQRFFSALRVAHGQRLDRNALHIAHQGAHQINALRLVSFNADDAVGNVAILHDGSNAGKDRITAFQHLARIRGQIRLTLSCVDQQGVNALCCQLDMRRETGAAKANQTAGLHSCHQALFIGHNRRHTGRVNRLLAIGCNRNRLAGRTVDHAERCNAFNCARNAGIDIGTDKAAGFADKRTNTDLIAFFDDRLCRCTNVHRHGNNHVRRRGHCYGSHPGRALLMRHCGTLGRALQGFKHGLISPISLSALLWKAPEPVIPSPLITAIADTPFYKVKPSLPPLPAESKKLSRRADAVPWPQKQKPPAFIK